MLEFIRKRFSPWPEPELVLAYTAIALCLGSWLYRYLAFAALTALGLYYYVLLHAKRRQRVQQALQEQEEQARLAAMLEKDNAFSRQEEPLRRTQFTLVQKQISAHFAVNVINIIKLLTENGAPEKACEMCDGLAFLLQYANDGDELVDGLDELFILQRYVSIIAVRYQNLFTVTYDIDDNLEDLRLPRMLLQPLVENAVMHGFRYMEQGGLIVVKAAAEQDALVITVSDNGCGMSPQTLEELETKLHSAPRRADTVYGLNHIALSNIQSRIRYSYGPDFGLTVRSRLNLGTTAILRLPLLPIAEVDRIHSLL